MGSTHQNDGELNMDKFCLMEIIRVSCVFGKSLTGRLLKRNLVCFMNEIAIIIGWALDRTERAEWGRRGGGRPETREFQSPII